MVKSAREALADRTSCIDIAWSLDIRLELVATAARGILDRRGIFKSGHIYVICLLLQESQKLVPLVKRLGEVNTADLMAKFLGDAVIPKHLQNRHLVRKTGRSDTAAKLHAMFEKLKNKIGKVDRQLKAEKAQVDSMEKFSGAPRGNHWSERGEHGRWVRNSFYSDSRHVRPMESPERAGPNDAIATISEDTGSIRQLRCIRHYGRLEEPRVRREWSPQWLD